MMAWRVAISAAVVLACGGGARAETVPDAALCMAAISTAEPVSRLPQQMLGAIGVVESGRTDGRTGQVAPWPWTVDVAGAGHLYGNAADAIAAVRAAQASGVKSIDVGCMQINLQQHPNAFATLEQAFDPLANVRYAASFLNQLYSGSRNWGVTVAAYHSSTPAIGAVYLGRVVGAWPLSARYGVTAPPTDQTVAAGTAERSPPGRSAADLVDPDHVMTPTFRAEMVAQAAFRRHRDTVLGLVPSAGPRSGLPAAIPRAARRGRLVEASLRP